MIWGDKRLLLRDRLIGEGMRVCIVEWRDVGFWRRGRMDGCRSEIESEAGKLLELNEF
jgi:hypothetical protein